MLNEVCYLTFLWFERILHQNNFFAVFLTSSVAPLIVKMFQPDDQLVRTEPSSTIWRKKDPTNVGAKVKYASLLQLY